MAKNFDDFGEDEEVPLKLIDRFRIISHKVPGYLVMAIEYSEGVEDMKTGRTTPIYLAINTDAADMLGATLINSAKERRKVPQSEH